MADEEKKEKPLTPRQKAFVEAYCGEAMLNGTKAAGIAKYSGDDNALAVRASELLRIRKIREAIDALLSDSIISANEVLTRLARQAQASIADVLTEDGEFSLREAKRRGTDSLIKKLKVRKVTRRLKDDEEVEDVSHEYEMYDAQAALVHLGRFHALFTDKQELEGGLTVRVTDDSSDK